MKEKLIEAVRYAKDTDYSAWNIPNNIKERLRRAENVCLFGVGTFFHDLQKKGYFKRFGQDIEINFVCDNDTTKQGTVYETNIREAICISFEELILLKNVVVLITIGNYYEVKKQLDCHGIENYPIADLYLRIYDNHYMKEWFEENENRILETYDLFDDKKSKEVYVEVICNRIAPHLANKCFDQLKEENEYFSTGLFEIIPEEEYIVDCGAYTGDSLQQYMELFNNKIGRYYCLELNNYIANICQRNVAQYKNENIYLIRAGVSDKNETIQIADFGLRMSSTFSESSKTMQAKLVRLDDLLKGEKVTYIKMDVEGEEYRALLGAKRIIQEQNPKLAISAYHFLSDLWEIPQLIHTINPKYKLYLRHHTTAVWDTDCYAVVK